MKVKLIFLVLITAGLTVCAQKNAVIKFDTIIYDFGKFKEDSGKVNTTFNFSNTGTDTLNITDVKPSCGCITAEWNKYPVLPGQKGFVKVTYDPTRRPGKFEKSLWVHSDATVPEFTISIKGEVIPKPQTLLDSFPVRNGNLLLGAQYFTLRNVGKNQIKRDSMMIYNDWKRPMTFTFSDVPAWVTCRAKPTTLGPKKKGKLYITYDASKKNDYGLAYDNLMLVTNDSANFKKQLTITATITDNFPKLTPAQRANLPRIVFTSGVSIDYGTAKEGDTIRRSFEFKNEGKDTLFIRKAITGMDDCKVSTAKSAIAGGESGKIDIEFITAGKSGDNQRRNLQVVTNDPDRPFNILIIKGNITPK